MLTFLKKYEYWLVSVLIVGIVVSFNLGFFIPLFQLDFSHFTGIIGIVRGDKAVYISMIEQVRQGSILNDNLFTSEIQTYKLFHPLWFILGVFARFFNTSSQIVFHVSKIISGVVFLGFLYFISRKFLDIQFRILFLFGLGFFGGLGRLFVLFDPQPMISLEEFFFLTPTDIWVSESVSFLTLYHSSLFIISQLLMVASWWWLFISFKKNYKYSLYTGLGILLLGLIHPYDIVSWWAVVIGVIILTLFKKEYTFKVIIKNILPSFFSTVAVVLYFGFLLIKEPVLSGWHDQMITPSPILPMILIGYGLLWVLSIIGLVYICKNKNNIFYNWLIIWFLTLPLLLLTPNNISRRFISSFGIVIVLISVIGIQYLWKSYGKKILNKNIYINASILTLVIVGLTISPLYQVILSVDESFEKRLPIYMENDERKIFDFLKDSSLDSITLGKFAISNLIPSFTGRRVYLGHSNQTIHFDIKKKYVNRFYTMPWSAWHSQFILENGIDYIIWPTSRMVELPNDVRVEIYTDSILLLAPSFISR